MTEQIVLGSGYLYVAPFTDAIPEDSVFETEGNKMGRVKGGATLEYKPTEYEVKDDSGAVLRRFIISEETILKSGVLTWNVETLKKLSANSTFEDDSTNKLRTLKIGGVGAREMQMYAVRFVHTKPDNTKIRITIVGTPSNGFTLAFLAEAETVIDAQFKALSYGAENTHILVTEEYETA